MGLGGRCRGCGAAFQHDDPGRPGYVTVEVWARGLEEALCRRCYRATHYGELAGVAIGDAEYQRAVKAAVAEATVVWLVVDIIDFAGSFAPQLLEVVADRPLVVVANKIDLLPGQSVRAETREWVEGHLRGRAKARVVLTSSTTGEGVSGLFAATRALGPPKGATPAKVAVIGVTNTGKSSLIARLMAQGGGTGVPPTISKYPGTTLGLVRRQLPEPALELIDTPGVIPPGRVSDLVCPECLPAVIPAKRLNSKLFAYTPGQALLLGGLCQVTVKEVCGPEAIMLAYAAEGVKMHRTSSARAAELLTQNHDLLVPPCTACRPDVAWAALALLTLQPGEDLAIPGLGWISVRRATVSLEVRLPAGVAPVIRPALVGPRAGRPPRKLNRGAAAARPFRGGEKRPVTKVNRRRKGSGKRQE